MNTAYTLSLCLAVPALLAVACSKPEFSGNMKITFEVETSVPEENDVVYITGNHARLGDWEPSMIPMDRVSDSLWSITLSIPYGVRLEYKFTLGSWGREAIDAEERPLANFHLAAVRSQTAHHVISRWRSDGVPSEGVTGDVRYHLNVTGKDLVPRHLIVWLPPGYETSTERYPVLYAHDGQNLFDPKTSFLGTDWGVDEALTRLIGEGSVKPVIVVGIYNSPARGDEYGLTRPGEAYQRFVVQTVKPLIDATYRTRPGRDDTATMGSSMGGLVSFLLAWNYPEVFKQAACLSPAFFPEAVALVREADALPAGLRIYMDNGTEGLEQKLQPMCEDMMEALAAKDYASGHPDFDWFLDQGAEHNEAAWSARIDRPLRFLFGTESATP